MYLFVEDTGGDTDTMWFKANGSWVEAVKVYKKVSGAWVEQADLTQVFDNGTDYVFGGQ